MSNRHKQPSGLPGLKAPAEGDGDRRKLSTLKATWDPGWKERGGEGGSWAQR